MTQIVQVSSGTGRASDARIIGLVSAAHFVSHFYILILPPLFAFVRADYAVSYTELGLALTVFNAVSAVLQTPAGFLADRIGAATILVAGLVLGGAAFVLAGLVDSFWFLVAMFALAGLGNTVYHPADYAILAHHLSPARLGPGFSIHTSSGMLGSAAAPVALLMLQSLFGWRGAFIASGALGLVVAAVLILQRDALGDRDPGGDHRPPAASAAGTAMDLLLSGPILRNLLFFVMLAITGSVQNYAPVALDALFATPLAVGNSALSAFLLLSAIGVLAGGWLTTRTNRHAMVAAVGLVVTAGTSALIGAVDLGAILLVLIMSLSGFFNGVIMPSRDMIVRSVTPPGSFGKVFGFVTTGFNIGGIVSPLLFGWLLDGGHPRAIFMLVAAAALVSILTVLTGGPGRM
ncbi:MAG TPA: MFS transporter [Xanthobacteraceae bacterium]|nr:MFS transporter [Xanthobacteraceae bacterium]